MGRLCFGFRARLNPASSGVLFAFKESQRLQADTIFSQVKGPPRSFGITLSRESSSNDNRCPQYWQVNWSRARIASRLNEIGTSRFLSYDVSRTTFGIATTPVGVLIEPKEGCSPLAS